MTKLNINYSKLVICHTMHTHKIVDQRDKILGITMIQKKKSKKKV